MPDVLITAPVAADSVDRLALGASDARAGATALGAFCGSCIGIVCMAEE